MCSGCVKHPLCVLCHECEPVLMCMQGTQELPSRPAMRILHGLPSLDYLAAMSKSCGYWGRYSDMNFTAVLITEPK